MGLPVCVVTDPQGRRADDEKGRYSGFYIREILGHAGVPFCEVQRPVVEADLAGSRVVVLPWHMTLSARERGVLEAFVSSGGALIGLGGASGLDGLFGVEDRGEMADGYLQVVDGEHPVTAGLNSSLHCFGGRRIKATKGPALARVTGASDGVVEHRTGAGWTLAVGPDLVHTILQIQQGHPVLPAAGPTRIDVIKGLALDLDRDRRPVPGEEENLVFLEPIADEFRGMILRAVFQACRVCKVALPVLWYWPDNRAAIAHMSHDSDGGNEAHGWTLLNLTKEVGIKTTWCIMAGHYQPEFYEAIKEYGSEIALHYDAQTYQTASDDEKEKVAHLKWGYDEFVNQLETVEKAAGQKVTSNKNHTLRWQGRLEFFRWCEQAGVTVEESRGPNTPYTNGFPFGGSHPWFPMDDEAPGGPVLDVLEVNLTVQDIHRRCSIRMAREFGNRAFRHYGIAHYLFHPAHTWDPAVRGGLRAIVGDMRDLGMEWWTAERIGRWERARRQARFEANGEGYRISTGVDLEKATVLVLETGEEERVSVAGAEGERVERYGFDFQAVTTDLKARSEAEVKIG